MTNAQRSHFESLLLSERKRTLRDLASIAAELEEAGNEGDNQPSPESYGRCAECRRPISLARLELVPATRFCASHATHRKIPD